MNASFDSTMSFRAMIRPRAMAPVVASLSIVLIPRTTLHAEAPEGSPSKKPIYDDDEPFPAPPSTIAAPRNPFSAPKSTSPTPTERLAKQIGKSRLFVQGHVAAAETKVNSWMDTFLHMEDSFTGTIRSLAPPPQSGEKLMPDSIYVLVAAMTGSILTRHRGLLLRGAGPLAVGVGAAWVLLPVTMQNVSDLVWEWEKRFPVVADSHARANERIQRVWSTAKAHSRMTLDRVDEKVSEGREAVEGWVRKGK